jgi:hypothetical protein
MSGFLVTIRLRPGVSKALAAALSAAHIGALGVVPVISAPQWLKIALIPAVLLSLLWSLRWHVWHRGDAITEAILEPSGAWWVTTAAGAAVSATLRPGSLVQPFLTVLVFKLGDGRRRSLVLLADNCDPEAFRLLRVRLRFPLEDEFR